MKRINLIPSEEDEQITLMEWAATMSGRHPELRTLIHIPNGGSRNKVEAAKLKAMGVRAGVPDLFLPVARCKYHGLWIELKRRKGGRVSEEQNGWLTRLREQGYAAVVCRGAGEAMDAISRYLRNIKIGERTEVNIYDEVEEYTNCTVQILRNSVTGEESVGWWINEEDEQNGQN